MSSQSDLGLPYELIKARVSERLMLGVSNAGPSVGNTHQFCSKMWGITHDVCQGVECKNVDWVGRPFERSMVQKNVNLFASNTVISERFSFHKFSDLSVDSRKVLRSDNLSSELDHVPMFEINNKIDCTLKPKDSAFCTSPDKSFAPQKDLKVNMCTSNPMAFSSQEYQLHSHRMVDVNMSKCSSACGILSHQDKHAGLSFDHAGKKLKGHLSIEESCSCSKNGINSSCSLTDKLCTSNLIVNSKEAPRCSSENNLILSSSRVENENVGGTLLEIKFGVLGGGRKQQDFDRVAHHGPVFGRECEKQPVNDIGASGQGMVFANLLQSEHDNLHVHRVNSAMTSTQSCDLPCKIENTMETGSKVETLALGKPPKDKLADGKRKATCLFEMLTLPSKSQGFASTSTYKDYGCPNTGKAEQIATSSIRGVSSCSGGNGTLNVTAGNHKSCLKETFTDKQEWSMPKASSINLDLVLFQISRMKNPMSSVVIESPVCSEPSDKWLKRLQHDALGPHLPCSKRSKVGYGSTPGGACAIFGQELNFDMGKSDMINQAKEVQLRYGRLINQQNLEGSLISSKKS